MEYLSGFGNHFETEAMVGTLPRGQNSPKKPLKGLVPEQLTGSAFTMERNLNFRSWLYRIHPSTSHNTYQTYSQKTWVDRVGDPRETSPSQFRWQPLAAPTKDCDFVDGVFTMAVTESTSGVGVNHFFCNQGMGHRYFMNADAEMIFLPEQGSLQFLTEMGELQAEPQEIVVIPRGVKFQVNPQSLGWCRGYMGENKGHPLVLPNLGPLGANALANARDFLYPVAAYNDKRETSEVIVKFTGGFWRYEQGHSPLDVVAWHGNYAPYKYDLRRFNTMGTISYDHPDPSIFTVLTSPSATPGTANMDFVIFPPRWLVGENTFRPPYYHRNVMSEYMGLLHGVYDAKQGGFVPGGASLHNRMTAHGPDTETFYKGIENSEDPQKIADTMAFMFESCHVFHPTSFAMATPSRESSYTQCWQNFKPLFGES